MIPLCLSLSFMSSLPNNDLQVSISNRQILRMALPISLAMLVPQINFVMNTIFLGGLGETELGTAGITGVFYLIFALTGNGLNAGLQGLLARRAGENRPEEIGRLFMQGLWIAFFFAMTAIILTFLFAPYFLSNSLRSEVVKVEAISFLKIRVWGVPFLYFFQMCNAMLVGTNHSRYMKYGFWIMAGINILLDYALIYGKLGFPQLGFNGAAWASIIAEITGLAIVLGIIFYKKLNERFSLFKFPHFNKERAGLIFRQSSPLVVQWLLSIFAWLVLYIFIEHKGERQLAISNSMRTIFGTVGIFAWAFASTSNAMVSNIIGQDKKDKVIFLINKISLLSFVFTLLLCFIINIFPGVFLGIYNNDPGFISEGVPVLRTVTIGIAAMSVSVVWLHAVTGTGNTKVNLIIEIIAIAIYTLYIYLVLKVWDLGLVWAWASEFLYWGLLFTLSFFYIRSGHWKKKVI